MILSCGSRSMRASQVSMRWPSLVCSRMASPCTSSPASMGWQPCLSPFVSGRRRPGSSTISIWSCNNAQRAHHCHHQGSIRCPLKLPWTVKGSTRPLLLLPPSNRNHVMELSIRAQEPTHVTHVGHLTTSPVSVCNVRWHPMASMEANRAVDREVMVRADQQGTSM
jgi:hypothetical protein